MLRSSSAKYARIATEVGEGEVHPLQPILLICLIVSKEVIASGALLTKVFITIRLNLDTRNRTIFVFFIAEGLAAPIANVIYSVSYSLHIKLTSDTCLFLLIVFLAAHCRVILMASMYCKRDIVSHVEF